MGAWKYGMVCSNCGAKGLSEVRVDATGHDWCLPCAQEIEKLGDMETAREERISNGLCNYECECDKCVELDLEISRIDLCDIADWELSFEVELTQLVLPSVLDQPVDHPVQHSWQHAQYK